MTVVQSPLHFIFFARMGEEERDILTGNRRGGGVEVGGERERAFYFLCEDKRKNR